MQAAINQFKVERLISQADKHNCRHIAINRNTGQWSYSSSRANIDTGHHRFYSHPDIEKKDNILVMSNYLFNIYRSEGILTLIEIKKNQNNDK